MPDSYGVSLIRLRTRFPNKNDTVSNPAASPMAMMAWSRTGKYVSVSVLGMRFREMDLNLTIMGRKEGCQPSMIEIVVNGETKTAAEGQTILGLLLQLELDPERVAVELDRRIVRQPHW